MRDGKALKVDVHVQRPSAEKLLKLSHHRKEYEGKYLGEKLNIAWDGAPIHSPKSRALARDTPQATMRVLISVCADT